jgi:hypothetical protein
MILKKIKIILTDIKRIIGEKTNLSNLPAANKVNIWRKTALSTFLAANRVSQLKLSKRFDFQQPADIFSFSLNFC